MNKLLVSDFDRTLYVDSDISQENLRALEKWKQNGNLFAIATGRGERSLREKLCKYHTEPDYLICNNGARVVDRKGKILFERTIEDDIAWDIIKGLIQEYHMPVDATLKNRKIHVFNTLQEFEQICRGILQIHLRFKDADQTQKATEMVNLHYGKVKAFANEWNLDIVCSGVDKAEGVTILLKTTGWQGRVITVGDSYNDLCMLKRFGGYTMSSADEKMRNQALYICKSVADCMEQNTP